MGVLATPVDGEHDDDVAGVLVTCPSRATVIVGLAIFTFMPIALIVFREFVLTLSPPLTRALCRESRWAYVFFLIVLPAALGILG